MIPSAAKNLHGTAFTFVIKQQQVPVTLKETACAFVTKSLQVTRLWRGLRALSGETASGHWCSATVKREDGPLAEPPGALDL